jgi:natural product biosynthesis luciferase-like monooxygenase protein
VEHRNVSNFFTGMDRCIGTEPGVWLALTSISFDISVLEIFWTLGRGFKVVLQEEMTTAALKTPVHRDETPTDVSLDFGLFFFASDAMGETKERYRLLLDAARFADENGFSSVWTPERHFHSFGGIFPNPAITGAALATITKRIQIRAGSCVLPLHNAIRVAEEWAVVDNLSEGRIGLSFASGWHPDDFVLLPENYKERKQLMFEGIETVRALWRGESVEKLNGLGDKISVSIFPRPIQKEPPVWITSAGNSETFEAAGELGANILTNLLGNSVSELAEKLIVYRVAREKAGHKGKGIVTLMLHTFVEQSRFAAVKG